MQNNETQNVYTLDLLGWSTARDHFVFIRLVLST